MTVTNDMSYESTNSCILNQIQQSLLSQKLVCHDGLSNFELPLLVRNSTCTAKILCGLSYKV